MLSIRSKAEILLLIVTFIWGATFVIVKEALNDASPLVFVAARFMVAGVLLFLILARGKPDRKALVPAFVLGIFLFLGFFFQTWGQEYTTPSKCAFITGFSVILVPLLVAARGAPLRRASLAGALLGLAGIYFLVSPSAAEGINRGDVLTLVSAFGFAIYIVLVEVYARRFSFVDLAPAQILIAGLLACAGLPFDPGRRLHWTAGLAAAIAVTAILATAFAFAVQNWAQKYVPAAHTALIFAFEPVFAALTSYVVLGERLGSRVLFGSALILAGMVVSERWS
ncbi:MAG TPA: DMT family transporter [Terriglobia bacterium]|nr:DMT family transporter [Terriglobia bacterium]